MINKLFIIKILLIIFVAISLFECSSKKDDSLVIPPDFNDLPDPNNPEKNLPNSNQKDLEQLKNILLKSEE